MTTEQRCRDILCDLFPNNIFKKNFRPNWLENPSTGNNLELDCYNGKLKLALEYNGEQHYKQVHIKDMNVDAYHLKIIKQHDNIKKAICKELGIYLIIVPYTKLYELKYYICKKIIYGIKNNKIKVDNKNKLLKEIYEYIRY